MVVTSPTTALPSAAAVLYGRLKHGMKTFLAPPFPPASGTEDAMRALRRNLYVFISGYYTPEQCAAARDARRSWLKPVLAPGRFFTSSRNP